MKLKFGTWSLTPYLIVVLLVGLQACGGGSSDPVPAPTDQNASGIYTGTGTVNSVVISDFKGMIYNNRFMIFSVTQNVVYDGTITNITLSDMTGTADIYDAGVKTQAAVNVTATVTTESQIQSFTIAGTDKGNAIFDLTYDGAYKLAATSERIKGAGITDYPVWTGNAYNLITSQVVTNFEVDITWPTPNFSFSSSSASLSSCRYEGDISIPSVLVNIYSIVENKADHDIGTGDCTLSNTPNYTGYGTIITSTNSDDTLWYVVTNGTHSVVSLLTH